MTNLIPPDLKNGLKNKNTIILISLFILVIAKLTHIVYEKVVEIEQSRVNHYVEKKQGRG